MQDLLCNLYLKVMGLMVVGDFQIFQHTPHKAAVQILDFAFELVTWKKQSLENIALKLQ